MFRSCLVKLWSLKCQIAWLATIFQKLCPWLITYIFIYTCKWKECCKITKILRLRRKIWRVKYNDSGSPYCMSNICISMLCYSSLLFIIYFSCTVVLFFFLGFWVPFDVLSIGSTWLSFYCFKISEEEARKKIYNVSCDRYFGFGCEIDEETSNKLEGLLILTSIHLICYFLYSFCLHTWATE